MHALFPSFLADYYEHTPELIYILADYYQRTQTLVLQQYTFQQLLEAAPGLIADVRAYARQQCVFFSLRNFDNPEWDIGIRSPHVEAGMN